METQPLEQIYSHYFPIVREKCRRMLGDSHEAQDVAQETMMRLWRSDLGDFAPGQLVCWLYRTSTHLAIDVMRRNANRSFEPVTEVHGEDLDARLYSRQLLASVARRVPRKELELALLHRVDGLSQQEIAETLGISDRTVRRLLSKVDERLERLRREECI